MKSAAALLLRRGTSATRAATATRPSFSPTSLAYLRALPRAPAGPKKVPRRTVVSHHGPNPRLGHGSGQQQHGGGRYQHYPPPGGKRPLPLYIKVSGAIVGTGCVLYISSYEKAPYTGRWRPMPVSHETELQLGEASNRAMLQKFHGRILPPDHKTARLLVKVGRKLAAAAGCEDLPWEFHVIDDDSIMNAAAMPGGKVVIFTGLKQCVTTEEELAAVLGHEISHVVLRHSAEQMARAAAMNYLFIFLALLGLPINEMTLLLGDLTVAKPNSRTHELEADEVGVLLCAKAGYDPAAAIRVFQRMEAAEKRQNALRIPGFLSTHPAFPDRIAQLRVKVEQVRSIYEDKSAAAGAWGWGSAGAA